MRTVTPSRIRRSLLQFAVVLVTLAAASAVRAQTWNETGDAGSLVGTAQTTIGSGPLNTITGNLASADDVDLYCIQLLAVPPAGLPLVQLQCVIQQGPNVWLFDAAGNGVFTNTTCSAGNKTLLAPNVSLPAGTYYVAVAFNGDDPVSASGDIWIPALGGQRTPDGPGAAGALTGWVGSPNVQPLNPYQLNFSFMGYCSAATPTLRSSWGTLKSLYR